MKFKPKKKRSRAAKWWRRRRLFGPNLGPTLHSFWSAPSLSISLGCWPRFGWWRIWVFSFRVWFMMCVRRFKLILVVEFLSYATLWIVGWIRRFIWIGFCELCAFEDEQVKREERDEEDSQREGEQIYFLFYWFDHKASLKKKLCCFFISLKMRITSYQLIRRIGKIHRGISIFLDHKFDFYISNGFWTRDIHIFFVMIKGNLAVYLLPLDHQLAVRKLFCWVNQKSCG